MARTGVTQDNVNEAADALLLAGERPTIERVRTKLGTGSPNTLIRLLDVWWSDLGARLQAQNAKLQMPDAPEAVASLAHALWEKALEEARRLADEELRKASAAVAQDRESLEVERRRMDQSAKQLADDLEAAKRSEAQATARLDDATRMTAQQASQLEDVARQRDASQERAQRLEHEVSELRSRQADQEAAAMAERARHDQYVEALEKRTSVEVDRARQEARTAKQEVSALVGKHERADAGLRQERDDAVAALAAVRAEAIAYKARADILERQQAQLSELAETVRGAIKSAKTPTQRHPPKDLSPRRSRKGRST
ncbi:DNA-binding protein [Dokdonella sp. MW10]|uniref:DNA-binding protein n=1 Tax=Dokdonella sp. MW10 TaxID=2992926 RepID=UPI003F812847